MKYLIFLMALLISFSAMGQADLLEKKGRKYYFKGDTYKYKDLGPIYRPSFDAYNLYKSGKKKRKDARAYALVGLGLVGGGVWVAINGEYEIAQFGGGAIILGVVSEIIALLSEIGGFNKLTKAYRTFNYEMIEKHGYQSEAFLSLAVSGNGVGFVLQF